MPAWMGSGEGLLPSWKMAVFSLLPHMVENKEGSLGSLIRAQIPFMRVLPSRLHYLPKDPPPKSITLELRNSTQEFGGDTNVMSMLTTTWCYFLRKI